MRTVNTFVDAVERLLGSNMISSATEIRSFLIALTEDADLKDVIKSCSSGYIINDDYKKILFDRSALPQGDGKKVAFVTALLFAIDTGKIDLSEFLKRLYPTHDVMDGYTAFLSDFIKPYAESFVNIIVDEPVPDVSSSKTPVYDKMNTDVSAAVNEIIANVSSSFYPDEVKSNIKFAGNGLIYALTFKDSFLTEIAYRGFINALRRYNIKTDAEALLTSTLKLYGVI